MVKTQTHIAWRQPHLRLCVYVVSVSYRILPWFYMIFNLQWSNLDDWEEQLDRSGGHHTAYIGIKKFTIWRHNTANMACLLFPRRGTTWTSNTASNRSIDASINSSFHQLRRKTLPFELISRIDNLDVCISFSLQRWIMNSPNNELPLSMLYLHVNKAVDELERTSAMCLRKISASTLFIENQ